MSESVATVFIVDDDHSVRHGLVGLLGAEGYRTRSFGSADELLAVDLPEQPGCLVLDVRLPGMDGFELQRRMAPRLDTLPVIFVTGCNDVHSSVLAMKQGALGYLSKPFRPDELLESVAEAMEHSRDALRRRALVARLLQCLQELTPREYQVFCEIVSGRLNKQVADVLGITVKTVKVHRRHVMEKTGMRSITDLVRLADRLGIVTASCLPPENRGEPAPELQPRPIER
jgi:FixJ family two-component response regulator